jgi:hypothetical protein
VTLSETLQSTLRSKCRRSDQGGSGSKVSFAPATAPSAPPIRPRPRARPSWPAARVDRRLGLGLRGRSLDTSIGTIQDVESYLEVPVLGLIPLIDPLKDPLLAPPEDEDDASPLARMRPFLISLLSPRYTVAEAYRSLRTNVEFLSLEKSAKAICMTSASLMEGKTTTAINLAISIAQMGKKTLLVEADLRKPFLHHAFGLPRDPGLTEVIVGNKEWRECLRTATDLMLGPLGVDTLMSTPNIDKLYILTSGTPPPSAEFSLPAHDRLSRAFASSIWLSSSPPSSRSPTRPSSARDGTLVVYRVSRSPVALSVPRLCSRVCAAASWAWS